MLGVHKVQLQIILGIIKLVERILQVLTKIIEATPLKMNKNLIIKIKMSITIIITLIKKTALINLKMNLILMQIKTKILIFIIQVTRIQMQLQTHHLLMKN